MKVLNTLSLTLSFALAFTGCSVFQKKTSSEDTEPPELPKYEHVTTNTPENTESYWASGEKPEKLKIYLNKENSFTYFHNLHSGKRAGFSQVSIFNPPASGTYRGKPIDGDSIIFTGQGRNISFSTTNATADIYIPDVGFAVLKTYVETNTPLVVLGANEKIEANVIVPTVAEVGRPNMVQRQAAAQQKSNEEPIQEGLVAELLPQLEAMQQGPTRFGVE